MKQKRDDCNSKRNKIFFGGNMKTPQGKKSRTSREKEHEKVTRKEKNNLNILVIYAIILIH